MGTGHETEGSLVRRGTGPNFVIVLALVQAPFSTKGTPRPPLGKWMNTWSV